MFVFSAGDPHSEDQDHLAVSADPQDTWAWGVRLMAWGVHPAHMGHMDLCVAPGVRLCLAVPRLTPTLVLLREWAQDLVGLEGPEAQEGLVWALWMDPVVCPWMDPMACTRQECLHLVCHHLAWWANTNWHHCTACMKLTVCVAIPFSLYFVIPFVWP